MISLSPDRRAAQLALYALHLASGHSLQCRTLKAATVSKYIFDVASMITPLIGMDPRRTLPDSPKLVPQLQLVFEEMRKWERVSDKRREPFTPAMLSFLHTVVNREPPDHSPDSLLATLADFFTCGLFAGYRQSEWSQDNSTDPAHPDLNKYGQTAAFCLLDSTFLALGDVRITLDQALALPAIPLAATETCWRTQKNNQNGEKKRFATNFNCKTLCYVEAMRRICQRFVRIRGSRDTSTPLSIYLDGRGTPTLVTARDISQCMQYLAGAVYQISDPRELTLFSAHSLQVGACVILHAQGFTDVQIQHILRWRSLAFMAYLRNLTALSTQQNTAFNNFVVAQVLPPNLL